MMWHPYKWVDDLAEKSGWWIVPYVIFLRIFMWKFLHSISDQEFYTFAIIFLSIFSFFGIKLILKISINNAKHYKICLSVFSLIYVITTPIYAIYFLKYHPLLGTGISSIFILTLAMIYRFIMYIKNKEQVYVKWTPKIRQN